MLDSKEEKERANLVEVCAVVQEDDTASSLLKELLPSPLSRKIASRITSLDCLSRGGGFIGSKLKRTHVLPTQRLIPLPWGWDSFT